MVDETGVVCDTGSSPASLFGIDPQQLLGKPVFHFVDVFHTSAMGSDGQAGHGESLDDASTPLDAFAHTRDIMIKLSKL